MLAYNVHMAGVDVNSQLGRGSMTCRQKTNRWSTSAFFRLLDGMRVNAFVLARRDHRDRRGVGRLSARHAAAALGGLLTGLCHGEDGQREVSRAYGLVGAHRRPQNPMAPGTPPRATVAASPRSMRLQQTQQRHASHVHLTPVQMMQQPFLQELPVINDVRSYVIEGEQRYHKNCQQRGLHPTRRAAK